MFYERAKENRLTKWAWRGQRWAPLGPNTQRIPPLVVWLFIMLRWCALQGEREAGNTVNTDNQLVAKFLPYKNLHRDNAREGKSDAVASFWKSQTRKRHQGANYLRAKKALMKCFPYTLCFPQGKYYITYFWTWNLMEMPFNKKNEDFHVK